MAHRIRDLALPRDSEQRWLRLGQRCLLWLALLGAPASGAASGPPGLLWQVSRAGTPSAYLFGTVHSADARALRIFDAAVTKMAFSVLVVVEVALDTNTAVELSRGMLLRDGDELATLLDAPLFGNVMALLQQRGMPMQQANLIKPWAAMTLISFPPAAGGPVVDQRIYEKAVASGKRVAALESVTEQLAVLDGLSQPDQIALLRATVDDLAAIPVMLNTLHAAYAAQDLDALQQLAAQPLGRVDPALEARLLQRLLTDRNQRMAARLPSLLAQGPAFVAVGALHLPGADGLLARLRAGGYEVNPVALPVADCADALC
jgi:uncharacterized protein YbaP (TraB family)